MFLARVIGTVTSTIKHEAYQGTKLMLVQPISPEGEDVDDSLLAVDTVGAGVGEKVIVLRQGVAAAQVLGIDRPPIRSVIVGIVDELHLAESGN
jgi:ethanolamine utilization protein EutN